jgi:CBS domain containing-hemolysin-like protein
MRAWPKVSLLPGPHPIYFAVNVAVVTLLFAVCEPLVYTAIARTYSLAAMVTVAVPLPAVPDKLLVVGVAVPIT